MKFITHINSCCTYSFVKFIKLQINAPLYRIIVHWIRFYVIYSLFLSHFLSLILKQPSNEVSEYSVERIELTIYRAITRDACRICSEIPNFCGKRSARRIDTAPRRPTPAILQRAFCLWQPLVRNDKHNVHEIDQQPPNISGNYVAFGVITQALRVFTFQYYV